MALLAVEIDRELNAGEMPNNEQLRDAARVASGFGNSRGIDGAAPETATAAHQYACLLNGDSEIDALGDVIEAKRRVAS